MNASVKPPVALLMPTFRNAATLSQTVASIQRQTYSHWQLLIIDDASDDNTAELALTLAEADERILVAANKSNSGFLRNWQRGLTWGLTTRSKYIALLDPEDLWQESWLETLVNMLEDPTGGTKFGIAQSWSTYAWIDKPKCLERQLPPLMRGMSVRDVFRRVPLGYGSAIHGLWRLEVVADVLALSTRETAAFLTHEDIFVACLAVNHGIGIHPKVLFTKIKSRPTTKDYSGGDRLYHDFRRGSYRFGAAIRVERYLIGHLSLPPWGRALFAWRSAAFMVRHEAARRRAYNLGRGPKEP